MVNNKYTETLTSEDLEKYDVSWFKGEIVVIEDLSTFRESFPKLKNSPILGFDTETRPSFKKGKKNKVSLIQLANENIACLIRINKVGIPAELAALLANPSVIKAGVAVHDDIRFLRSVKKFIPSGFIDLQKMVKDFGIQSSGLKKLAAIVLGFKISKRQQVTDWEADFLTDAQKVYAATDAWVCHQIYNKLNSGKS
ncbi:MAG: 3'-5' exonuclease [Bacteroidales bacterium]